MSRNKENYLFFIAYYISIYCWAKLEFFFIAIKLASLYCLRFDTFFLGSDRRPQQHALSYTNIYKKWLRNDSRHFFFHTSLFFWKTHKKFLLIFQVHQRWATATANRGRWRTGESDRLQTLRKRGESWKKWHFLTKKRMCYFSNFEVVLWWVIRLWPESRPSFVFQYSNVNVALFWFFVSYFS